MNQELSQVATQAMHINVALRCYRTTDKHMSLGLQDGLGKQTLDTNVALRGSMDHIDLLRKSNLENELFVILYILWLLRPREIMELHNV